MIGAWPAAWLSLRARQGFSRWRCPRALLRRARPPGSPTGRDDSQRRQRDAAGRSIEVAASIGDTSVLDGSSTVFASALFTPPLPTSDAPDLRLMDAGTFRLSFGAPMLDPGSTYRI